MNQIKPVTKTPYPRFTNQPRSYNSATFQSFYGTQNTYAIYPDYWKAAWGPKPLLGTVRADDEYYARYAALDKGLLPPNGTFGPKPFLLTRGKYASSNSK